MSKILVFVSGGVVQWVAGSPDVKVTVIDHDKQCSPEYSISTQDAPDVCVPDDMEFFNCTDISREICDAILHHDESGEFNP